MKNVIRALLALAVLMIWASLFVGAQDLGNGTLLAHDPVVMDADMATRNINPATTSSIRNRQMVNFQLFHDATNHEIEVRTDSETDDLGYRLYGFEGRAMSEGVLPSSGRLEIPSTAVGTYIIALYREEKVVGMKKIVLM